MYLHSMKNGGNVSMYFMFQKKLHIKELIFACLGGYSHSRKEDILMFESP